MPSFSILAEHAGSGLFLFLECPRVWETWRIYDSNSNFIEEVGALVPLLLHFNGKSMSIIVICQCSGRKKWLSTDFQVEICITEHPRLRASEALYGIVYHGGCKAGRQRVSPNPPLQSWEKPLYGNTWTISTSSQDSWTAHVLPNERLTTVTWVALGIQGKLLKSVGFFTSSKGKIKHLMHALQHCVRFIRCIPYLYRVVFTIQHFS